MSDKTTPPSDHPTPPVTGHRLMEYLYILPAILAISPLIVAYRQLQGMVAAQTAVYAFRLMTLAWLWMMTAAILYIWRPSLRLQYPFVLNVIKATCLGCLGLAPVVLVTAALTNVTNISVQFFTPLEKISAATAFILCVVVNLWFLKIDHDYRKAGAAENNQSVRPIDVWELVSMAVMFSLTLCIAWLVFRAL